MAKKAIGLTINTSIINQIALNIENNFSVNGENSILFFFILN